MTTGYMLLSALIVNGAHGYLVYSQRNERKRSISSHAANSRGAYLLYLAAHLLGGIFFLLFAHELFLDGFHQMWLYYLSWITVVFESVQAFIPSRGRTEKVHILTAYCMWLFYLLVGTLAVILIPLSVNRRMILLPFLLTPMALGIYAYFNRKKMYWLQMLIIGIYCSGMILLSLLV